MINPHPIKEKHKIKEVPLDTNPKNFILSFKDIQIKTTPDSHINKFRNKFPKLKPGDNAIYKEHIDHSTKIDCSFLVILNSFLLCE